jgi:hypothetical protein
MLMIIRSLISRILLKKPPGGVSAAGGGQPRPVRGSPRSPANLTHLTQPPLAEETHAALEFLRNTGSLRSV